MDLYTFQKIDLKDLDTIQSTEPLADHALTS